jgi:hypothetical protein
MIPTPSLTLPDTHTALPSTSRRGLPAILRPPPVPIPCAFYNTCCSWPVRFSWPHVRFFSHFFRIRISRATVFHMFRFFSHFFLKSLSLVLQVSDCHDRQSSMVLPTIPRCEYVLVARAPHRTRMITACPPPSKRPRQQRTGSLPLLMVLIASVKLVIFPVWVFRNQSVLHSANASFFRQLHHWFEADTHRLAHASAAKCAAWGHLFFESVYLGTFPRTFSVSSFTFRIRRLRDALVRFHCKKREQLFFRPSAS